MEFVRQYGEELKHARETLQAYSKTGEVKSLDGAWEVFYKIFRRINKQITQATRLDLERSSTFLFQARDLNVAVPGTAESSNSPLISIQRFQSNVTIIMSKQRPRKVIIYGSDGKPYSFLLKGHEDLRQDERVMQFFGLVNNLMLYDSQTKSRRLQIRRFPVVPLSQDTGLIGWVPHCDTIHALIRDHREANGVLLSLEHRNMLEFGPDYDHLPVVAKVEVFTHALACSDGNDMRNIIWKKSQSSEVKMDFNY